MSEAREILKTHNLLPSTAQELLLQACLLPKEESLAAWRKWQAMENQSQLDRPSARLQPLLFKSLESHGITENTESHAAEFKKTWFRNQLLIGELKGLLRLLQKEGIQVIVLKGAALLLNTYPSFGHRPMADLDILVALDQIDKTMTLLEKSGWASSVWKSYTSSEPDFFKRTKMGVDYFLTRGSTGFQNKELKEIDLHSHAFVLTANSPHLGSSFWNRSQKMNFANELSVQVLSETDNLLHTLVHGVRRGSEINLRWVADAVYLIRTGKINWELLLSTTKDLKLNAFVKYGLLYINELLPATIPEDAVREIQKTSISKVETTLFNSENEPESKLKNLKLFWARHNRISSNQTALRRLIMFPRYVQRIYLLERLWQVPFLLIYKASMAKNRNPK